MASMDDLDLLEHTRMRDFLGYGYTVIGKMAQLDGHNFVVRSKNESIGVWTSTFLHSQYFQPFEDLATISWGKWHPLNLPQFISTK